MLFQPLTVGAHDRGFLGLAFGIFVAQILFSIWFISFKWPIALLIGVAWGQLSICISFWTVSAIIGISAVNVKYVVGNTILFMQFLFFIILILLSIAFFEVVHRMANKSMVVTPRCKVAA